MFGTLETYTLTMFTDKQYTFDRVIRLSVFAAAMWALISLFGYLADALIPFVVAMLLAYLLNPLVSWVQTKVQNRLAAVLVTLTGVFSAFILLVMIVQPMIGREVKNLQVLVTDIAAEKQVQKEKAMLESGGTNLVMTTWVDDAQEMAREMVDDADLQELLSSERLLPVVGGVMRKVLPGVVGVVRGATSILFGLFGLLIILLYLIFLLMDYDVVRKDWKTLIPKPYRAGILEFLVEFDDGMSRYFRGQAVVASCTGVLAAIGLGLIDLPLGILLGLFVGLLNMVPYLQILGMIPAILLAVMKGLDPQSTTGPLGCVLLVLLVFAVVQLIQDAYLVPKIMGRVTGLSPAIILLSISIWGTLLGLLGVVIALPMTCLVLAYYKRFLKQMETDGSSSTEEGVV